MWVWTVAASYSSQDSTKFFADKFSSTRLWVAAQRRSEWETDTFTWWWQSSECVWLQRQLEVCLVRLETGTLWFPLPRTGAHYDFLSLNLVTTRLPPPVTLQDGRLRSHPEWSGVVGLIAMHLGHRVSAPGARGLVQRPTLCLIWTGQ